MLIVLLAAAAAAPLILDDVTWQVTPGREARQTLTISRGSSSSNGFTLDERAAEGRSLREILAQSGPVAFTLDREAGTLRCVGTIRLGRGAGGCRFTSQPAFEAALAARGMTSKRREQIFEAALVDARIGRADGLAREGFRLRNADDLIGATALDVTGDYARQIKSAGLTIRDFNDLIACRALKIDAAWVRGFTAAGYTLTARRAIAMKATGVTPAYARAMNTGAKR